MANPFTGGAAGFSGIDYLAPEVAQQQREIQRQQAIADLLRQQSLENNNQTQVVGGWAIPNSSASRFSQLGQALMAGYMQRKIDGKQAAVAQQLAERLGGVSYAPASQSSSATAATQPGTATTAPIVDGSVTAPSFDSRKVAAPGGAGVSSTGPDMWQAIQLETLMQGAGKAYVDNWYKTNQPTDWERQAKALFPGDPTAQADYMKKRANKEVSIAQQPGTTVVDMNGTTQVPMSEYQNRQLANDQTRLDLQNRSTAATELNANTAALAAGGNGGFAGTSMQAQANNSYMRLTLKQQRGETLSPEENMELQLAIRVLNEPKVAGTVEGGFSLINPPPLPGAPTPPPAAAPQNSAPPASPAARPDLQPNFPDVRTPGSQPTVTQLSAPTKAPNENQSKAAGFAARMDNAEGIFTANPAGLETYTTQIAGAVPKVGDSARRASQTPEQQKYDQAKEDWIRAVLRKESGASISDPERAGQERTYFPQPGDGPEVVKQKAIARQIVMEAMRKEAGPAAYESSVTGAGGGQKIRKWSEL